MSAQAMKLALEGGGLYEITGRIEDIDKCIVHRSVLHQAIAITEGSSATQGQDWSLLEATQDSLREHMARIKELEAALAKQEQGEPVMTVHIGRDYAGYQDAEILNWRTLPDGEHLLYTKPQPSQKPPITEAMIDEFLEDYEMIGESEDGRDACYAPNENDKALIKDAVFCLLQFADEAAHGIKDQQ